MKVKYNPKTEPLQMILKKIDKEEFPIILEHKNTRKRTAEKGAEYTKHRLLAIFRDQRKQFKEEGVILGREDFPIISLKGRVVTIRKREKSFDVL